MKYLLMLLVAALCLSMYGNYQLIARFNFMCGQVMGVVDGTYQSSATEEAMFRLGTMTDVCFIRGWDWRNSDSYTEKP